MEGSFLSRFDFLWRENFEVLNIWVIETILKVSRMDLKFFVRFKNLLEKRINFSHFKNQFIFYSVPSKIWEILFF